LKLNPKHWEFLLHDARAEFLEGTTYSGKTTIALLKFMCKAAMSEKRMHILCGLDLGTVEKNIIHRDLGMVDLFGRYIRYRGMGAGTGALPHIVYRTPRGIKIIYVLGYADKSRWKKALGGQYGCALVDEVNVADMDFVRELAMRCDYWVATLNPDDPDLLIYNEYVNRARPHPDWDDAPPELSGLLTAPAAVDWTHWYFTFRDNPGLDADKHRQIEDSVAPGSKLYRNKILGLRGQADGTVFELDEGNLITKEQALGMEFVRFACGVDTAYSVKSGDAIVFILIGITKEGQKAALAECYINNRNERVPVTPSELPARLALFLDGCVAKWGAVRDVFIDSADQASILECQKYKKQTKCLYRFIPAWKKLRVIDRLHLEAGWLAAGVSLVSEECRHLIREIRAYAWGTDGNPQDGNDHAINAWQYAWMPFVQMIKR